jgi:chromosome segregation ATPase
MTALLTRMKKELQDKTQQPKQSLIDLELADYEKTIKTLKDDLNNKDKEIQDLSNESMNSKEKILSLQQEIDHLEQQKLQTEERANKFQTLFETTKKELQDAKDLEQQRHYNDGNVRSLIDQLQIELDNNKVLLSQITLEKQQLNGKLFPKIFSLNFRFLLERLNNQNDTNQRTIHLLEQNLRIAKHDLDVAKKD